MKFPEETFVRTGINIVDRKMRGLKKGHVSVWSGLRASAKSTILSEIGLNAIDDGNNVAYFSGELTPKNFMDWMWLQAAGKGYVVETNNDGFYTTPLDTRKRIAKWLNGHFWLYNNEYGNNFISVIERFEKIIDENKLDLLVLDNLMAFDIRDLSDSKWDAQSQFVLNLAALAKKYRVHVAFVAHPRKAMGFLRFDDIAGTADLGNAVDDAFIIHRVNNDFKRYTHEMFGWKEDAEMYEATNVIEIVKDRDGGNQDVFIPLWYEIESKRLKNEKSENRIYGWRGDTQGVLSLADFTAVEAPQSDNPFE
jgi:archaellum biogenesis ATPase FlaH